MFKKVGIVGISGRLGSEISNFITIQNKYQLGLSYTRSENKNVPISEVFLQNDYVIDCSSPENILNVLLAATKNPKPLIVLTTGWDENSIQEELHLLSKLTPIIIAPNTSLGAYVQSVVVRDIAKILDSEYDIDIVEQHHRKKLDQPSGTALNLFGAITKSKKQNQQLDYKLYEAKNEIRNPHTISITSRRSGNIPGEHEVCFTSNDEIISVKHIALNRALFAKGALKIINWLDNEKPQPGIYHLSDIFKY